MTGVLAVAEDAGASMPARRVRLAQRRRDLGLTQEVLAGLLAVERSTVVRWERGETEPLPWIRPKLARALQVPVDRLGELLAVGQARSRDAVPPAPSVPRQLPAVVPGFTGRAEEQEALTRMLEEAAVAPGTVLICAICGTAGVGKTALALHWAHQLAGQFPDGQLHVNLRGFGPSGTPAAPEAVIRGFLDALGVPPDRIPQAPEAQAGLYRSLLASKRMLIVLDNARDGQQVRPLLPASPASLVLVTSRTQLSGLAAADGARMLRLDVLAHGEAVQLLTVRIGTRRAEAEPDAVAEIAALCAYLPLALAVAAARATARPGLPLAALCAELRDAAGRLDALDAGDPACSVRAVFSWSCRQLSGEVARMFRLLGLHPGPDISIPASASLAATDKPRARRLLAELTCACLITEHAPGRYAFHDLLRAYAASQAQECDPQSDRDAAIGRALDHYLHTAHAADRLLIPIRDPIMLDEAAPGVCPESLANAGAALAWFRAEHQVLIAAIGQAAEQGLERHAWQLSWALVTYLERQGFWAEWAAAQRTALEAALRAGDVLGQAHAHRQLARFHISAGTPEGAGDHLRHAIRAFHEAGDKVAEARARLDVARMLEGQGSYREAIEHALEALDLFRAVGHRTGQARALNGMGWCHAQLGEYTQTLKFCQPALDLHRELGYPDGEAGTLDSLGYAHHHLGHHAEAVDCYHQALRLYRADENRYGEAACLGDLGDVYADNDDMAEATRCWRVALTILDGIRHPDAEKARAKLAQVRGATGTT